VVDIRAILRKLAEHEVEFIVVGGVAAVLAGAPINTFDLDVVYRRTPDNLDRLLAALSELDAVFRGDPRRIRPNRSHLESAGHKLLATRHGDLDCLGSIEELWLRRARRRFRMVRSRRFFVPCAIARAVDPSEGTTAACQGPGDAPDAPGHAGGAKARSVTAPRNSPWAAGPRECGADVALWEAPARRRPRPPIPTRACPRRTRDSSRCARARRPEASPRRATARWPGGSPRISRPSRR
jgi:hypothetical protein